MDRIVYLNGNLVPWDQARISPFDHGFLYGYALFETMRAYSGHIFRLPQHIERLARSAGLLGLPLEGLDLEIACHAALRANGLQDARLRLTVSIGAGEPTPDPPPDPEPTVLVTATAYKPLPRQAFERGFKAVTSSFRVDSQSPLSRLKTANYLGNLLARREAKAVAADEALLHNERGLLCEGSTANVFYAKDGILVTPNEDSGCLPGITRQAVIELASARGIGVETREVRPEELVRAGEAFLTNSLLEVMPLTEVDGRAVGSGGPGSMTGALAAAYRELVANEAAGGR
jgi:branched-chain amino acid aminotransferase